MRYLDIKTNDDKNGPGFRTVLFVSGCSHHCEGCHNPETWDPSVGVPFDLEALDKIFDSLKRDECSGLTLSGGDPLYPDNRESITALCKVIRDADNLKSKTIWLYTGYLFEQVKDLELMKYIDVVVDGPFVKSLHNKFLLFKGSKNQRLIDVKKSLLENSVVLYDPWSRYWSYNGKSDITYVK